MEVNTCTFLEKGDIGMHTVLPSQWGKSFCFVKPQRLHVELATLVFLSLAKSILSCVINMVLFILGKMDCNEWKVPLLKLFFI